MHRMPLRITSVVILERCLIEIAGIPRPIANKTPAHILPKPEQRGSMGTAPCQLLFLDHDKVGSRIQDVRGERREILEGRPVVDKAHRSDASPKPFLDRQGKGIVIRASAAWRCARAALCT